MGVVVSKAGEGQDIIYADIDPQVVHTARQAIPVTFQRRFDVYPDVADNEGSTKVVVYGATQE
jgi:omega-amidase